MESLVPVKDDLADLVSQSRRVHVLVEEPKAPVQTAELVNSSEAEASQGENEMVVRWKMGLTRFVLGARPLG